MFLWLWFAIVWCGFECGQVAILGGFAVLRGSFGFCGVMVQILWVCVTDALGFGSFLWVCVRVVLGLILVVGGLLGLVVSLCGFG